MSAILLKAADIIITAIATGIAAAVHRHIEKKRLRKEGKLKD